MFAHEAFMSRCLTLAAMGAGNVSPNPMVGAVLVHAGNIIGEGYHEQYGRAHAELNCIYNVKPEHRHLIKDSTMYVSLEPCAHYGKTPPCADLIIAHGIKRVVIGSNDPNPLVAGNGIKKLRHANVEVIEHVLEEECDRFNRRFMTFYKKHRPYLILKWAQSADGFFAPEGQRKHWLTNEYSKAVVHKWRAEEDGILIGSNTAIIDDPQLTSRLWPGKNPVRILIDLDLKVPADKNIFNEEAMTIVYNRHKEGLDAGTVYVQVADDNKVIEQIANDLYQRRIQSVIIEGGAATLTKFIDAGLWDEARVFTSPQILSSGIKAPHIEGEVVDDMMIADDRLVITRNPA